MISLFVIFLALFNYFITVLTTERLVCHTFCPDDILNDHFVGLSPIKPPSEFQHQVSL